jgi:hypothetical protein
VRLKPACPTGPFATGNCSAVAREIHAGMLHGPDRLWVSSWPRSGHRDDRIWNRWMSPDRETGF